MQPTGATVAVNVWPAMVAVNFCWLVVAFGDAVTVTVPLPVPDVGATEIAALEAEVVHTDGAHPDGDAETFTTCEPPPVAKDAVAGEIANVQALVVGVGWVGAGVDDGLLHANERDEQQGNGKRTCPSHTTSLRFIQRAVNARSPVVGAFSS